MQASYTQKTTFPLASADAARLEEIAPLFNIDFRQIDQNTYALKAFGGKQGSEVLLRVAIAHRRLLAEISERAAKWVHFHLGESCRNSLLGQCDARLSRVAVLYALNRDEPRQKTIGW